MKVLSTLLLAVGLMAAGSSDAFAQRPSHSQMKDRINTSRNRDGNTNGLGTNGTTGDGQRLGPKPVNPTYGPNGPGPGSGWEGTRQPREIWARNSDPVVAMRDGGGTKGDRYYDSRTGETLSRPAANEALNRQEMYGQQNSVQIYEWDLPGGEVGMNAGPFENGRWTLAGGPREEGQAGGELNFDVLRAEAGGTAQAGFIPGGVQANVDYKAQATLVGINGEYTTGRYNIAGPVNGETSVNGQAYIGAEATLNATAELSTERLRLNGRAGAFAGGKLEGEIKQTVGLENVGDISATLQGEISYGIGAQAEGYFNVDWTNMSVKFGGRASAALGVGAGLGFETEISVKPAVDWVVQNGGAVVSAAGDALSSAGSAIAGTASAIGKKLCFWCSDPPAPTAPVATAPGTNVTRNAPTTQLPPPQLPPATDTASDTDKAQSAGTAGALGRN